MKKISKMRIFGFIALAAIIGFSMIGCGDSPGDTTNHFTGTVWEGQTEDGDDITITFTDTTWTVDVGDGEPMTGSYTYSGNTATLTIEGADGQATATISESSLTVDAEEFDVGVITFTKKTSDGPVSNPFADTVWEGEYMEGVDITVTFTADTWTADLGGDNNMTGPYTYTGNTATLTLEGQDGTATAVISGNNLQVDNRGLDPDNGREFTLTKKTGPGGNTDPETGPLTITGIPAEYNGQWVVAQGTFGNGIRLASAGEFDGTTGDGKGVQIIGGSVTLNVWEMDENGLSEFTGSGEASFDVYIISTETFNAGKETEFGEVTVGHGKVTVTFANGTGSGVFSADQYTITINGMNELKGEPGFICLHSDISNIDWDEDEYYGKGGTVGADGTLTVTFWDNWNGSGSYQIGVFFWQDKGASVLATYYYTNGAELNNATPLPTYDFDADDANTVLNFSKFRNANGSGPDPVTGPLTITGFDSEYNGNWVLAMGMIGDEEDGIQLLATGEFSGTTLIGKGAQISGGSVSLNVFEIDTDTMAVSPFTGNGEADFEVFIINTETFDVDKNPELEGIFVGHGSVTVTFTDGTGSGKISEIDDDNGEGGGHGGGGNPPTMENLLGTWKAEGPEGAYMSWEFTSSTSTRKMFIPSGPSSPMDAVYEGTFSIIENEVDTYVDGEGNEVEYVYEGYNIVLNSTRYSQDGGDTWNDGIGQWRVYNVSISDDGSTMTEIRRQDPTDPDNNVTSTIIYIKQ